MDVLRRQIERETTQLLNELQSQVSGLEQELQNLMFEEENISEPELPSLNPLDNTQLLLNSQRFLSRLRSRVIDFLIRDDALRHKILVRMFSIPHVRSITCPSLFVSTQIGQRNMRSSQINFWNSDSFLIETKNDVREFNLIEDILRRLLRW